MKRLALAVMLCASSVVAETCKAPNIAREVQTWSADPRVVLGYPGNAAIECEREGPCWRFAEQQMPKLIRTDVVCLTPEANEQAEARGK